MRHVLQVCKHIIFFPSRDKYFEVCYEIYWISGLIVHRLDRAEFKCGVRPFLGLLVKLACQVCVLNLHSGLV